MDHSEAGFLHIEVDESLADIHQEAVAQVKPKQGIKRSRDSEEYVTLNQAKKLTMNISRMVAYSMTGYIVAGGQFGATVGFLTSCAQALQGN